MPKETDRYYLLNVVFMTGLCVLFLNDHYWKLAFANAITGKLSDFAGVLILPMLLSYLFPRWIKVNIILAGILFIYWKSPISEPFIQFYNDWAFIKIHRVVDYTDLMALVTLPVAYLLITRMNQWKRLHVNLPHLHPWMLLLPSMIVLMATSPPAYYRYTFSDGELKCYKCTYTIPRSKEQLLGMLAKADYTVMVDTLPTADQVRFEYYWKDSTGPIVGDLPYYKIDTLILDTDTLTNLQFALERLAADKTKIWINGMNVSREIPDRHVERRLRKYYYKLVKQHFSLTEKAGSL